MPSTRTKFVVNTVGTSTQFSWSNDAGKQLPVKTYNVELSAVFSPNEGDENHKFWKYTPSGKITLSTVRQDVGESFKIGTEYYVDFTPVVEQPAQTETSGG